MTVYSNNHTIITVKEFLDNPEMLVENTLNRQGADLIIVSKTDQKPILWITHGELLEMLK